MGSVALDASAVIALLDGDDAHHRRAVDRFELLLAEAATLSMASSAYSEIMVHAIRVGRGDHIDALVDRIGIEMVVIDRALGARAAELRAAHRWLRLPDALVLAAARARGARLLTFDARLAELAAADVQS